MPTYSRQINFNSFEQGGFYVSPYHQEYDSSTEIRSPIIDVDFYNSKISIDCGDFQWSFVCFDSSGNFINIQESLGYKNSGDEIDISAYTQAKKIRIELHSDNGISPPQTCNLVYTVYYSWYINDYGEIDNDKFLEITEPMSKPYPNALWRIDSRIDDGIPYNKLLLGVTAKGPGAFCYAEKLIKVSIPESVKKIGKEAFRHTALRKVRIAADCEYSDTSFPENCEITFYGGIGNYDISGEK